MRSVWADWGARLVLASRVLDRAYQWLDHLRSELVLMTASDALLDRYNDLTYGDTAAYRPDSEAFRSYLFSWEEQAITRFFPVPPARILIGGAGGGREAFVLAERGYEVVAFEPSVGLARGMQAGVPKGAQMEVYQASYEELPVLRPVAAGAPATDLDTLKPFDAAILGWCSFTHLRTEQQRVATLASFARVTRGPILNSFFAHGEGATPRKPGRLRRLFPGRYNRDPGNRFAMSLGLYHEFVKTEMEQLVGKAQLEILHLHLHSADGDWPHAVMVSPSDRSASVQQ